MQTKKILYKIQYHVYKGRITNLPLSTFETLYIGFEKEVAEKIYNENKKDKLVHIEKEEISFNIYVN